MTAIIRFGFGSATRLRAAKPGSDALDCGAIGKVLIAGLVALASKRPCERGYKIDAPDNAKAFACNGKPGRTIDGFFAENVLRIFGDVAIYRAVHSFSDASVPGFGEIAGAQIETRALQARAFFFRPWLNYPR
jgi:hypothetical protein